MVALSWVISTLRSQYQESMAWTSLWSSTRLVGLGWWTILFLIWQARPLYACLQRVASPHLIWDDSWLNSTKYFVVRSFSGIRSTSNSASASPPSGSNELKLDSSSL